MTEERKTTDAGAADDSRVSEVYRDIARERAPEHLDKAVLREAARAAQPRYSRLRLWTRPAAWAAVVLISATLLLQVSQLQPPPDSTPPQVPDFDEQAARHERQAPAVEEAVIQSLESASRDDGLFRQAEDMARIQQGPNESQQPAALRAGAAPASGTSAPACNDDERAAPETWLACILALEEAGMDEAARRERALLEETFPGFETP